MDVVLVGLNHKTAPIEVRELAAFPEGAAGTAALELRRHYGLGENLILSTCNRVEVLAHDRRKPQTAWSSIEAFLHRYHQLAPGSLDHHLYRLKGTEAIRHLFRVAGSLDSLVVGEPQILGQLKQAYSEARLTGAAGSYLERLVPQAFFVAKKIRNETRIGQAAVSVGSVAAELAHKIFGDLGGRAALLLGAGRMAELAAENLMREGISRLLVANRTPQAALKLADRMGGEAVEFTSIEKHLSNVDVALASTSSDGYLLDRPRLERVIRERKNRPLFLIDISVPRNIDPAVHQIDNVFLFDVDDLQAVVQSNLKERERSAVEGNLIVEQELEKFLRRRTAEQVGPLIQALRQRFEELCLEDLDGSGLMDEAERRRLERELRRSAHRLAHPIILEIKRSARRRLSPVEIDWIRRVFKLDVDL